MNGLCFLMVRHGILPVHSDIEVKTYLPSQKRTDHNTFTPSFPPSDTDVPHQTVAYTIRWVESTVLLTIIQAVTEDGSLLNKVPQTMIDCDSASELIVIELEQVSIVSPTPNTKRSIVSVGGEEVEMVVEVGVQEGSG